MDNASQRFLHSKSPSTSSRYITHPSLHIRDAQDALLVFEAVRLNILPLITRRLNGNERAQLKSGNIFVWEESEHKGALSRWTDGRRWSQSRMRGDYLWYQEQIEVSQEERDAKAARRARKALDPSAAQSAPSRRQDRPAKPGGLIKQTYSTLVRHISGCRKWHIVAYLSEDDYLRLPLVDHYEYLRRLQVPNGVFLPGKSSTRKLDHPDASDSGSNPTFKRNALSIGTSEQDSRDGDQSSSSAPSSPECSNMSPRFSNMEHERLHALPRLLSLAPTRNQSPAPTMPSNTRGDHRTHSRYLPRSPEDRKAIESFRPF